MSQRLKGSGILFGNIGQNRNRMAGKQGNPFGGSAVKQLSVLFGLIFLTNTLLDKDDI